MLAYCKPGAGTFIISGEDDELYKNLYSKFGIDEEASMKWLLHRMYNSAAVKNDQLRAWSMLFVRMCQYVCVCVRVHVGSSPTHNIVHRVWVDEPPSDHDTTRDYMLTAHNRNKKTN